MRTEQIILALCINRERSIKKAADSLSLSRANASIMLKTLENELGFLIFERMNNTVAPTEKGILFLEQASQIERSLQMISQITEPAKSISLRICSIYLDFAGLAFKKLCMKYCGDNYSSKLNYKLITDMSEARSAIRNGDVDVAIGICRKGLYDNVLRHAAKMHVETEIICERLLQLTCRKGHPIIKNGKITNGLFKQYPAFISVQAANSDLYAPYYLAKHDIEIQSLITMEPIPMRYELMNQVNGYLISLPLPEAIMQKYDLESVAIKGTEVIAFAAYNKGAGGIDLIQEYIGYCREFV